MSSSISALASALRALHVQLAQARKVAAGGPARAAQQAVAQQLAAAPAALQALRTQLRAARDADGRLSGAKALRLFVQAALLDELGKSLQLDPALGDLVERTCQAIESDPASATLLAEALFELQAWVD